MTARPAVDAGAQAARPEPYTEQIAGTTVSFQMVPVPGAPAGSGGEPIGPFWISRTEVPWDVYDIYVFALDRANQAAEPGADAVSRPSKPYVLAGQTFGHQGHPALGMTHHAATEFARWLSAKTGKKYRLATEAEWEHACRAGAASIGDLEAQAWFAANSGDRTHPVGTLAPNAWGVHDLLGNAGEWVVGRDGTPVVKGGAYSDDVAEVGCTSRREQDDTWNMTDPQLPKSQWWLSDAPFVGLRIVREP